jgi:hypothetical protein
VLTAAPRPRNAGGYSLLPLSTKPGWGEFREIGWPAQNFIGKNASVLLAEIGVTVGDEVRLVLAEVPRDHPLVVSEQMMPIMPLVRVASADEGIDLAKKVEHGFRARRGSQSAGGSAQQSRVLDRRASTPAPFPFA